MPDLLFYGDPHGVWAPLHRACAERRPAAAVLLGDCDLDRPLADALGPVHAAGIPVWWIHGNHESDRTAWHDHLLHAPGYAETALHARVVEIAGWRVAGLGGVFRGQVWHPDLNDGEPAIESRERLLWSLPAQRRWRGGLPLRHRTTIFPEDYAQLFEQSCDLLVTHEAPTTHRYGLAPIDELAEAMGARWLVHGHHHESYRARLTCGTEVIGLAKAEVFRLPAA